MDSGHANIAFWSYAVAAACFAAFAVRLALGWRRSPRAVLLLAAILASTLWAASAAVVTVSLGRPAWLAMVALDAARYASWLLFLMALLKTAPGAGSAAAQPVVPRWSIPIVIVGLVLSWFLLDRPPFGSPLDTEARTATFGLPLAFAIFGLILVEQLVRRAADEARWAIKPLCIGLAGVFAFDLYYYADAMLFGYLDPDIWIARAVVNALVIPFIAVATARNTGWSIEMHVSRSAVFHSTAILVSGAFLLMVAGAGYLVRYFGGEWGRALQISFSFAALLLTLIVVSSGSFRSKLKVFVSKHFFSYRYDYREEWLRFTRTLSAESALPEVQQQCIKALADLVESPGGALWLKYDTGFRLASRWNMTAADTNEPTDASLPRFLEESGWVIDIREYRSEPGRYPDLTLPPWLVALPSAWLIVPLPSQAELVGFVVLATPRATVDVNWEVLDLLKTACRQAASFLGQTRATEALIEARKFDAFNRMSAFVVHDLKNLVAQLSLMIKNAERHRDNPVFQRDMIATVDHVVGRMNHLMLQLRTEAVPVERSRLIQLVPIIRRICAAKSGSGVAPQLEIDADLATLGHEERLEHVIGHLLQNALDATPKDGAVTIRLRRDGSEVVLEVQDTGAGMTGEFIRDRLFKPFESTKPAGMGIGVYESAQYISSIGGKITFDSAAGRGTLVRVTLPATGTADAAPFANRISA